MFYGESVRLSYMIEKWKVAYGEEFVEALIEEATHLPISAEELFPSFLEKWLREE